MKHLLPLLFVLLSACSHSGATSPQSRPLPDSAVAEFQKCDDSSECVRVDNGCCDCANGGGTVAVNRKQADAFRARFDCGRTMCTQMAGDCMFREPVCVNHRCALGKQPQKFPVK